MGLLIVSLLGLLVGNGLFVYWLIFDFHGLQPVLENRLALGFIVDAFLALGVLAWLYAKAPQGRVRWPWFVLLSIVGGLGFSIPFYTWLNRRAAPNATRRGD